MNGTERLKLQETETGYDLYIDGEPVTLEIENGIIKNKLTTSQLRFVKNNIE